MPREHLRREPHAARRLVAKRLVGRALPLGVDGEGRRESNDPSSEKLTLDDERLLPGNAMHVSAVEGWVLCNIVRATRKADVDRPRDHACACAPSK